MYRVQGSFRLCQTSGLSSQFTARARSLSLAVSLTHTHSLTLALSLASDRWWHTAGSMMTHIVARGNTCSSFEGGHAADESLLELLMLLVYCLELLVYAALSY